MGDLFDGSDDSDVELRINNSYAKSYDNWRAKEQQQKLKDRYGDIGKASEEETSSSSDDEDAKFLTPDLEKRFFKTLSCLKQNDPCIYDENVRFFEKNEDAAPQKSPKKEKKKPFLLRDYDRQMIVEKQGKFSEDEDVAESTHPRSLSPTYVEEQKALKDSFKEAIQDSEDEEESWGGFFHKRSKTQEEKDKEENEYKEWLKGQKHTISDKKMESGLKYLHDYWNNPNLDPGEAFLRDYILNRKFLDNDEEDYIPTYNEIVHSNDEVSNDEEELVQQDEFERKYNFRFEEPDQEFIKQYPRTIENSLRKKDDRRSRHRAEVQERKKKEKLIKEEELKQLKALKKKEILAKIEKLKEVTGNSELAFDDEDFNNEFNPEEHDKKMQKLFDDYYYDVAENEKPEFPELDEELELENWENWEGHDDTQYHNDNENDGKTEETDYYEPHCEDPDFNMDCEYDPNAELEKELIESSKGRKKQRKKSKFASVVSKTKPTFDPNDKRFEEYFDEYYKLDCEDIIDNVRCRFKYRQTVPNNYGLTVDEILRADEKELNRWVSLKKVVRHNPTNVEMYDKKAYAKKAQNEALKRKLLPSLYRDPLEEQNNQDDNEMKQSLKLEKEFKHKKSKSNNRNQTDDKEYLDSNMYTDTNIKQEAVDDYPIVTNIKEEPVDDYSMSSGNNKNSSLHDDATTIKNEKKKRKHGETIEPEEEKKKKKKKRKHKDIIDSEETEKKKMKRHKAYASDKYENTSHGGKRKPKWKEHLPKVEEQIGISDSRLKAYGLNPKKVKNRIIFQPDNKRVKF